MTVIRKKGSLRRISIFHAFAATYVNRPTSIWNFDGNISQLCDLDCQSVCVFEFVTNIQQELLVFNFQVRRSLIKNSSWPYVLPRTFHDQMGTHIYFKYVLPHRRRQKAAAFSGRLCRPMNCKNRHLQISSPIQPLKQFSKKSVKKKEKKNATLGNDS